MLIPSKAECAASFWRLFFWESSTNSTIEVERCRNREREQIRLKWATRLTVEAVCTCHCLSLGFFFNLPALVELIQAVHQSPQFSYGVPSTWTFLFDFWWCRERRTSWKPSCTPKKKGRCKIRWRSARSIPYSSVTCAELPWTSSKRADQIEKTDCPFKGITIGCLNAVVHYSTPKQYLLFCTTQYLCRGQTHLPMASATCLFYVNIPVSQSCLDVIQPSTAVVLGPKNRSCWHSGIRMCSVHVPVFTQ